MNPLAKASHHVLLTRHQSAAQKTAENLSKRGYTSEILALSNVEESKVKRPVGKFDLLILTSPLAADTLSRHHQVDELRNIPVCCVGDYTAQRARIAGFTTISCIAPNAKQLADHLIVEHNNENILYPCTKYRSFDFVEFLSAAGHRCENWEIYANELVDPDIDQLLSILKKTDTVFLFSKRTAEHFFHVCERWLGGKSFPRHNYVAISQHVASCVPRNWRQATYIADEMTEKSMIDQLEAIAC